MDAWEVEARERVRDTLARYTHSGDRGRVDLLAECFLPEGVLEVKGLPLARGRPAIVAMLDPARDDHGAVIVPPHGFIRHHLSSVRIESVTRDRIDTAAYFAVYTALGLDHWGRYRDVFVPYDGDWLIEHRRVTVDAMAPTSYRR